VKNIVDKRIAEYWHLKRRKNTDRIDDEQAIKEEIEQEDMEVEGGRGGEKRR
jgi:hypothetical protein